jgi:hypothetical protein
VSTFHRKEMDSEYQKSPPEYTFMRRSCPHTNQNEIPTTIAGTMIVAVVFICSERLAVTPAKWKLEFKKDVIAGCHERLVRFLELGGQASNLVKNV